MVKRKTASSRLSRALQSIALWCRANRHLPVKEQQQILTHKFTRALRVLRNHGQLSVVGVVPLRGRTLLAEVAESPQPRAESRLEHLQPAVRSDTCSRRRGWSTQYTIAQQVHDLRNRMHQKCTYGSVGAPGRITARGHPAANLF